MSREIRILAFSGSGRDASLNRRILGFAVDGARSAGALVQLLNLRDFHLPIYDGDLEEKDGIPPRALELRRLFIEHDGLLISSPEYNSSLPPLLKNAIDWVSRDPADDAPLELKADPFFSKCVAIMSASPGSLGGIRMLPQLRMLLNNIGMLVLPNQIAVSKAHEPLREEIKRSLTALGAELVDVLRKLGGRRT